MALITYTDKQAIGTQPSIPDINKVTDSDMNEIKSVVNTNANELDSMGTTYQYYLTTVSGSLSPSSWTTACTNYTTANLPSGTYLFICSITYTGSGTGIVSTDMVIDGSRKGNISRATAPLVNGLGSTTNASCVITFNSSATHTLNMSAYCSVACSPNNAYFEIIRLK